MLYRGIIIFLLFLLSPVFLWGNIDSLIKLYELTDDPYKVGSISLTIAKSYAGKGWRLKNVDNR
ncbi:MAG TPA: hypothetical protein EYQ86_00010 [Bacteroidetes bacterium]|nr:hypothetical protein [Bacteroidota bacterium]